MTIDRAATAHGIFEAALELPQEQRAAFLDEACHGDTALRQEVASLLAFLDDARTNDLFPPLIRNAGAPLTLGERIGPYRVIRELGAGGMGVVFLAEREDVGKQVALKLLREGGMASGERVRRFLLERRVLARLEHPNIARLLDAGATESRTPYLVMEYVEGIPIDRYCDEHRLPLARRLELFRTVCQAVHHAHQSLVVHRDLKPSNILVTTDGQVKLLDFGIAKLLADHASLPLAEARTGLLMLTPEYASPEQVRGQSVTTASDVYSLGVVLYQLLTGSRPYQLASRTPAEVEHVVCETTPPRPSDIITGANGSDVGAARGTSIDRLRRVLRGDLDTIVLKALSKEPGRRYLSASQLSDDLRRHLDRLPVLARKDTAPYLMGKFLRRHWIGAGAAALILLSLVAGIAATAWQAQRAEAQRIVAEERFRDVRSLATTVLFEIHDAVAELPGATRARALLMGRGLEYLNRLSRQSQGDPGLQGEIAQAYIRLGIAQGNPTGANLGDLRAARISLTKALMLATELVDDDSTNRTARRSLALAHEKLGDVKAWTGDVPGAVADAREALRHWEYLSRTEPENANARLAVAISITKLGDLLGHPAFPNLGDRTGAELQYRRTLALLQTPALDSAAERRRRRHIALSHERLGMMFKLEGRYQEALDALGRSLALREELSREDLTTTDATRDVAVSRENLCQVHLARGNVAAAAGDCGKAVELYRGLHAADPGNAQGLTDLAVAESETADVLEARGQWTAALSALDRSTRLLQEFLRTNPGNLPAERQLARNPLHASMVHARFAGALRGAGRARHVSEALGLLERGRQALTASLARGATSEDQADRNLQEEAERSISRMRGGK
jgi:non-specific serine/threonine protein kinase/serine/threonine-protein kinase